ncbi:hypothetical protein [Pseudomonas putida]|uniref:hypothetical protein n=1 Tax=Pseudomonas putida TaxID=303 RepID=UPI003905BB23
MLDIALKAIITLMITALINKILSAFRIRQLYVAIDQVLDCHDINIDGYTLSVSAFNRGKDKEKEIQIVFPETTYCQIIAQSQPGATHDANTIKIDRLAPGESITLTAFLKGHKKITKHNLPIIKSEDVTGRAFWGRDKVWPSLGPAVLSLSFTISLLALTFFVMWSAGGPDQVYYNLRYHNLVKQGFKPGIASDNYIISKTSVFERNYPIKVKSLRVQNGQIQFPIEITNTEGSPQKIEIGLAGIDRDYYREANEMRIFDSSTSSDEQALKDKFSVPENFWESSEFTINPQETKNIIFTRKVTPNLQLKHLSFEVSIKGKDENGEIYSDTYIFSLPSIKDAPSELKITD